MIFRRRFPRSSVAVVFALVTACGEQLPEGTQQARGLLEGKNSALALSILFVVFAGGMIIGAIALDRFIRSRRALAELPEAEEAEVEADEPVVAGIGQGSAGVPKWLYGVYVVIPLFALMYIVANADVRSAIGPPEVTPTPENGGTNGGVPDSITISADNVQFDTEAFTLQADTSVEIVFENNDDGVQHNVAIYVSDEAAQDIFVGEVFPGTATRTYAFEAPAPGEYYFRCDVHPSMDGMATFAEPEAPAPDGEGGPSAELTVLAESVQFDTDEIVVPAETEVSITLDNRDNGVQHNIAVYTNDSADDEIFVGELFAGVAERTYTFESPPAGEYYFRCDVHPAMDGTFVAT